MITPHKDRKVYNGQWVSVRYNKIKKTWSIYKDNKLIGHGDRVVLKQPQISKFVVRGFLSLRDIRDYKPEEVPQRRLVKGHTTFVCEYNNWPIYSPSSVFFWSPKLHRDKITYWD